MRGIISQCIKFIISFISILFIYSTSLAQAIPYFGQQPPGITPIVFTENTICISTRYEQYTMWSPDGLEFYYQHTDATWNWAEQFYAEGKNGIWGDPVRIEPNDSLPPGVPAMLKTVNHGMFPAMSSDGKRIYVMGSKDSSAPNVWMTEKVDSGWSSPMDLHLPLEAGIELWWISVTDDQTIYITLGQESLNQYTIYRAKPENGTYPKLENMTEKIVSSNDFFQFVAPDESYIILSMYNAPGGYGSYDLWISYKKEDDNWTKPKNLGSGVNTGIRDIAAYVTPDGKYLFFTRRANSASGSDIYWMDAGIIDSLRHTNFSPYAKYPIPNQTASQGQLYSYTIPDSIFCDDDGDSLTYSATLNTGTSLPGWLSIDPLTGTLSGTPLASRELPLYVKITAKDSAQASGSCQFALYIIDPPSSVEGSNLLPNELRIEQNYPNPFNPTTTIRYSLPKSSFVKLTIYNTLGQKIRTLKDSYQSAGEHSVVWDATNENNIPVSSGMYFYRLQTDNLSKQKIMVLLR